jgi:ATP/ADP translocase
VAKEFIPVKDDLAAFFGDFTFYAGILTLVVQLLVTSRFLRRFGIGVALFALPVALVASSGYMLLTGTLFSAILLRGTEGYGAIRLTSPAWNFFICRSRAGSSSR